MSKTRDQPERTGTAPSEAEIRPFSFGRNWESFLQTSFTPERLRIAKDHILGFLEVPDLSGKYFLDIGCGSGLSSLAALDAGAERVVSFDLDPASVRASLSLRESVDHGGRWTVKEGSVLDKSFLSQLEPADIAYSWGVLHHTGSMWEALRNAASLVGPNGCFYVALYLTTPKSSHWLRKKKVYNRSGVVKRRAMEYHYVFRHVLLPRLIRAQNPIRHIKQYKDRRGMDFMTDIRDWLGGYPYEHASIKEVVQFCHKELGLNLENVEPTSGLVEYLFRPRLRD